MYIPQIDGLRFLAILPVLFWHAGLRGARQLPLPPQDDSITFLSRYMPIGDIGVDLFFFISAFIISVPFLTNRDMTLSRFYVRRLVRIEPPYIIVIIGCFVVLSLFDYQPVGAASFHANPQPLWQDGLASVFYIHGLVFNSPSRLNPPAWSLEVEIQFYLLCPLIYLGWRKLKSTNGRLIVGVLAIAVALIFTAKFAPDKYSGRLYWTVFGHAHPYILGVVCCDYVLSSKLLEKAKSHAWDAVFVVGLTALIYSGSVEAWGYDFGPALLRSAIRVTGILGIFLGAVRGRTASRILGAPWMAALGACCYSIYLVHVPVMQVSSEILFKHLSPPHSLPQALGIAFVTLVPLGILAGLVFFLCVEKPFAAGLWPEHLRRLTSGGRKREAADEA